MSKSGRPASTPTPPGRSLRQAMQFYLVDCRSPLGKAIDIFIITLNLTVCGIFVIETYPLSQATFHVLNTLEVISVTFFIIEYAARIYAARKRLAYIFSFYGLIDLVAILPMISSLAMPLLGFSINFSFINIIRSFKVFRIFRFIRFFADDDFFFGRVPSSVLKLARLIATILIIFFVSSGLFYQVEFPINPEVNNFGDAFYFTVVTLTTVGFGDITPMSEAGRWVVVIMIISGIILIPWQAGQVVSEWTHIAQKKDIVCENCGLRYHDPDASHCKACGRVIYQEYDG